ncbi:MAG TPA: CHAT domain-containing protein [Vicinamibacteria bacterium]|nr:CHAT domain-containing protein [Vicinamibacteria bacterium]
MGERARWCALALALSLCLRAHPAEGQTTAPPAGASLVVTAAAGDTPSVQGWKTGGAWTLRVGDPSGREVAALSWRRPAVVTLSWAALEGGRYSVACEPAGDPGATCELEVIGPGRGGDGGRQRIGVEAALRRGHDLLEVWSADACRRARGEFSEARDKSRALGLADLEVDALLGLAAAHELAGQVAESLPRLQEAVARADASSDRRRHVLASTRLASSLVTLGKGQRAKALLDEALRVALEADFPLGAAEAHLGLGDIHYLRSELREARREDQTALEAYQGLGNAEGLTEAHLDLGYTLADLSQDAGARGHFERALELARSTGDKRREATALRALGNVHSKMSEEQQAIRYFEAAQELFERAEDRSALAGLYNGLGEVHGRLNDLAAAIRYHEKAAALARATGNRTAEGAALLEIAGRQRGLGRLDDAADTYEKARAFFDANGDPAMVASALAGLGDVAAAAGRLDDAVRHLRTALGIMRSEGETRLSSGIENDLAEAYLSMGRAGPGREAAEDALRLAREAGDSLRENRALFLVARAARGQGALDEAKRYAEEALAAGEALRSRVSGHELRALFFEELEPHYTFYVDLLMDMERSRPEAPFERLAFEASERGHARVLLDGLQGTAARDSKDDEGLARERALREEIRAQALREDLGIEGGGPQGEAKLDEMLAELRRVQGLGQSTPSAEPGLPAVRGLEEIQAKLAGNGTLLLEYCLGAERSYLWAVSRDRFAVHVLPPRETLESEAREIYLLLTARQRDPGGSAREQKARAEAQDARFHEAGARLARSLLGSVDDLDAFGRLIIVTEGALNYIPFSALPHPRLPEKPGEYVPLILSHEIVRAPSLSAMVAMGERSGRRGTGDEAGDRRMRVAVLADPVFTGDDPRVRGGGGPPPYGRSLLPLRTAFRGTGQDLATLPRLLASREEAASIARAAPGAAVTVATDFRVNRTTAEEMLRDAYHVVHFATHGILNDERPELSGIVTSLVDEAGRVQDGFLRAQDVYGLRVTADVVVLSGCETALGRVLRGEGITGLVHAFLRAGADTVIASKWRVEDVATQELMVQLYKQMLAEGARPATALRRAQIAIFRRQRITAPFYWGAFEVHGLP